MVYRPRNTLVYFRASGTELDRTAGIPLRYAMAASVVHIPNLKFLSFDEPPVARPII